MAIQLTAAQVLGVCAQFDKLVDGSQYWTRVAEKLAGLSVKRKLQGCLVVSERRRRPSTGAAAAAASGRGEPHRAPPRRGLPGRPPALAITGAMRYDDAALIAPPRRGLPRERS